MIAKDGKRASAHNPAFHFFSREFRGVEARDRLNNLVALDLDHPFLRATRYPKW
jgi:hypothetical protein